MMPSLASELRSQIPKCFRSLHLLLGLSFCVPRYQFTCCQCTKLIHFQPVREFLVEVHTAKNGRVRCCLYTPVGCSRLLSAVNDLTATNLDHHVALHVISVCGLFLLIIMSSTKNRSTATNWRKNSMIGAIVYTSRMALARVVVLQILGVDGLMWSTHRLSQNDLPLVRFFQNYWKRSTNSLCIESTPLASYDRCKSFCASPRPS